MAVVAAFQHVARMRLRGLVQIRPELKPPEAVALARLVDKGKRPRAQAIEVAGFGGPSRHAHSKDKKSRCERCDDGSRPDSRVRLPVHHVGSSSPSPSQNAHP
jgi:hypothetical protein